jgi:hypothetical protein
MPRLAKGMHLQRGIGHRARRLDSKHMKRAGFVLAVLLLAGGLMADPLFCCTLPAEESAPAFSASAMDCCPDGSGAPGCAPRFEKPDANVLTSAAASTTSVPAAAPALTVSLQVSRSGSTLSLACAAVEHPPRLHLLNSQFRI